MPNLSPFLSTLLTGMGGDGAAGLLQMKQAGARTIVQDEKSCVVFGMPKEAIKLGAADHILSLEDMPAKVL
jgi:two-component system chemotaxis response regulator CheB